MIETIAAAASEVASNTEIAKEGLAQGTGTTPDFSKGLEPASIQDFNTADAPLKSMGTELKMHVNPDANTDLKTAPLETMPIETINDHLAGATHLETGVPNETNGEGVTQIDLNRTNGDIREAEVKDQLLAEFPEDRGYKVIPEQYLRDENGEIVRDDVTGEGRRIDFVVTKDGQVVKSVEVTSETASKTEQLEKEDRIREHGGNYIRDPETGQIVPFGDDVQTEVWRLP